MISLITPVARRRGVRSHSIRFHRQGNSENYRKRSPGYANRHIPQSSSINSFCRTSRPKATTCSSVWGQAFPVSLNFAVSGMERLVGEVRSALHRRKREETQSRRAGSGGAKNTSPRRSGPRNELEAGRELTASYEGLHPPVPRKLRRAFTTARSPPRKCFLLSRFLH